ncbi:hypothetical protein PFICI_08343 [Pestalotiopsis fici W106-1]|uniref:Uncharacterized protein n=1 Tax=Pestalotiopsis fici (strain W106-1 / CGMCC3.15140) TaxID=1229662 RepID=W3X488_PESFW|nr:uncharacterized protein PFICI_08343 [Pestalotiopsis fici W106-1]ETS80814.1 hypothetical protein PFICI_08343 [Pestalotiopsis fici W106-1]
MAADFLGLRVIWPPDGALPPKHKYDIVFVHGLHGGPISDWQNEDGVCWPLAQLPLDLGNARILAFGYDPNRLSIRSDDFYQGGIVFEPGQTLRMALMRNRMSKKIQVPLVLIGHDVGGLVIKNALCSSHVDKDAVVLKKTKHVIFLETPHSDLSWDTWRQISMASSSQDSIGRWKIWSAVVESTQKAFLEIASRFNITTGLVGVNNDTADVVTNIESEAFNFASLNHVNRAFFPGADHRSISKLCRGTANYDQLLRCIQEGMECTTQLPEDIQRVRDWLGRRPDTLNKIDYQKQLDQYHTGTGKWLLELELFRKWVTLESPSPILWVTGPEGCGKSVLCATTSQWVQRTSQKPAVVYLMLKFDHPRSEYQLLVQIALQLLDYLVERGHGVDTEVLSGLNGHPDGHEKMLKVQDLIKCLIRQCHIAFVFIDGLDEVSLELQGSSQGKATDIDLPKQQLHSTLTFLVGLTKEGGEMPLRIWCSSNRSGEMGKWIDECGALELPLDAQSLAGDVASYAHHRLTGSLEGEMPKVVGSEILETTSDNFLLAATALDRLQMSMLSDTSSAETKQLKMPSDIREAYAESLDLLLNGEEDSSIPAMKILSLVLFAQRPLKLTEIREALAISHKPFKDYAPIGFHFDGNEIQKLCGPFIHFLPIGEASEDGYLRLSHASVFWFLRGQLEVEKQRLQLRPKVIADACLKYLSQRRYAKPMDSLKTASLQSHSFLAYAARYWHKHLNESGAELLAKVGSFLRSPQFLSMIRFQSLHLNGSFRPNGKSEKEDEKMVARRSRLHTNPSGEEQLDNLIGDYQAFLEEWTNFLHSGILRPPRSGDIDDCFWGALGHNNFLHTHGTRIERNKSFLLEFDLGIAAQDQASGSYDFQETISDDGGRIAVLRVPIQSQAKVVRESWLVDGKRPPSRYGQQEVLLFDPEQVLWSSYGASPETKLSLVPIVDPSQRVSAMHETQYGSAVRIGCNLFLRGNRGNWAALDKKDEQEKTYWDDIVMNDSWIFQSRRRYVGLKQPTFTSAAYQTKSLDSDSDSISDVHTEDEDSQPEYSSVGPDQVSSAEEFHLDTASEIDSSDEASQDSALASGADTADQSDFESSSELSSSSGSSESQSSSSGSSSDSDSVSRSPNKHIRKHRRRAPRKASSSRSKRVSSPSIVERQNINDMHTPDDSDADDEESGSESDDETNSQPHAGPKALKHLFSYGRYCDLCKIPVVHDTDLETNSKCSIYYQCFPCGKDEWDAFDLCSACFAKGSWCKNQNHVLSRATFTHRDRRVRWEDGITQDTSMPVVDILVEPRHSDIANPFRYTHRHSSSLHDSSAILHPTLPLFIYPLDGREFLFGDLQKKTYFKFHVPFESCETSETAGNTCIPIGVSMRFSSCGRFVHVARFTGRSTLFAPLRLFVLFATMALSPKDTCSRKPRILDRRHGVDLGTWPKVVTHLPYVITWTEKHAHVSLTGDRLRVLRFPLHAPSGDTSDDVGTSDTEVSVLSHQVALPCSAQSRSVYFFPARANSPAVIILGSLHGRQSQPPVVVYLDPDALGTWKSLRKDEFKHNLTSREIHEAHVDEPDFHDDCEKTIDTTVKYDYYTLQPNQAKHFQDWLKNAFVERSIFCPSCFDLAKKLTFLGLPSWLRRFDVDAAMPDEMKTQIIWEVTLLDLVAAIEAGCQFCCYVAIRLFGSLRARSIGQLLGESTPRCCALGSSTDDGADELQNIIVRLRSAARAVGTEEQVMGLICRPLDQDPDTRSFSKVSLSLGDGGEKSELSFLPNVSFTGTTEDGDKRSLMWFVNPPDSFRRTTAECVLELYSLPDNILQQWIPAHPLTTFPGGGENLRLVKSWIHTCDSSHSFCQRELEIQAELPTRVIQINDDRTIQLVETNGQPGRYVALSYCWGPDPSNHSPTITANFRARCQPGGLLLNELPSAIKDAISVTEEIGIRFIWVDALCIVQDDLQDKEKELGVMNQYYKRAYLTIAASTPDCNSGFLRQMGRCETHTDFPLPRDLVPLDVFCLERDRDSGGSAKVYVREENPYQLALEPINERAWTLQESLLSSRVLFFGHRVIWFCRHGTHSDGGSEDWSFDENNLESTRREFQMRLATRRQEENNRSHTPNSDDDRDMYDIWHRIVGNYSRRAMSRPEDKLPALSGLASEFAAMCKDEYIAGLWRSNLLRDLLWSTRDSAMHYPDVWRAPTWSWASVDDTVLYDQLPPHDAASLATIEEVHVRPKSSLVQFGEVQEGRLVMTLPCLAYSLSDEDKRAEAFKVWTSGYGSKSLLLSERDWVLEGLRNSARTGVVPRQSDDEKKHQQLPDTIVVALVYRKRDELVQSNEGLTATHGGTAPEKWTAWGLVLKPVEGTSMRVFERLFAFSKSLTFESPDSIFKDSIKTIEII